MPSSAVRFFVLALLVLAASPAARALTFDLTYASSVTSSTDASEIEAATQYVADQYEDLFTNPITINITIAASGSVSLGQSNYIFASGTYSYAQIRTTLTDDAEDATQETAAASLPSTDPTGGKAFLVTSAEAKALGLTAANGVATDGTFTFGTGETYTYDSSNRAVSGEYDFIGVAEHEISEIMGRGELLGNKLGGSKPFYEPFDLFRFTGSNARSISSTATGVYFSIDDGVTDLDNFNAPGNGGDLQDWATTTPYTADAYNAFSEDSIENGLTSADLTAMDVLGYDLIPEPPAWPLFACAGGAFIVCRRRRFFS